MLSNAFCTHLAGSGSSPKSFRGPRVDEGHEPLPTIARDALLRIVASLRESRLRPSTIKSRLSCTGLAADMFRRLQGSTRTLACSSSGHASSGPKPLLLNATSCLSGQTGATHTLACNQVCEKCSARRSILPPSAPLRRRFEHSNIGKQNTSILPSGIAGESPNPMVRNIMWRRISRPGRSGASGAAPPHILLRHIKSVICKWVEDFNTAAAFLTR